MRLAALIAATFLYTAVFLAENSAYAVTQRCIDVKVLEFLGENAGTGKTIGNFTPYEKSKKLLFIGDGAGHSADADTGLQVAERFPDKEITRTDIGISRPRREGNVTSLHMDNMDTFPFQDNSFDTIVLRKGLCHCHEGRACAGFCPNRRETKHFFGEVARVLDKSNPNSVAYLHGGYGVTDNILHLWYGVCGELEKQYGVKIEFQLNNFDNFRLMTIRPNR